MKKRIKTQNPWISMMGVAAATFVYVFAVMNVSFANASVLLPENIVGWWDMEEGIGGSIANQVASGTNAVISGASWTTGGPSNIPNGLDFNGIEGGDYAEVAEDYDLLDGTVCAWVSVDNFDPDANYEGTIVDNGTLGGEFSIMTSQRNGTDDFRSRSRIGGADRDVLGAVYATSTMYHLCHGWESSNATDEVELWIDGVSVASSSNSWGNLSDQNHSLFFGRRSGSNTRNLDGQLFQVVLLDRKISSGEIEQLYNNGNGITHDKLFLVAEDVAGWWDLEEGSGASSADQKSGGTSALISGASWTVSGPSNITQGLDFDGIDDYVEVAYDYDLPAGTACVWVDVDAWPTEGTEDVVLDNGTLGGETSIMVTDRDSTNDFRTRSRIGGSDRDVDADSKNTNTLYHVCHSWSSSGTTDSIELWVNGVSVAKESGSWGSISDQNHNLFLGRRSGSNTKNFNGKIYQTVMLNRKVGASAISMMYEDGAGATYSDLF